MKWLNQEAESRFVSVPSRMDAAYGDFNATLVDQTGGEYQVDGITEEMIANITPSAGELAERAKNSPPPSSWMESDDDPFSA